VGQKSALIAKIDGLIADEKLPGQEIVLAVERLNKTHYLDDLAWTEGSRQGLSKVWAQADV
jgi:hypothetical protein